MRRGLGCGRQGEVSIAPVSSRQQDEEEREEENGFQKGLSAAKAVVRLHLELLSTRRDFQVISEAPPP